MSSACKNEEKPEMEDDPKDEDDLQFNNTKTEGAPKIVIIMSFYTIIFLEVLPDNFKHKIPSSSWHCIPLPTLTSHVCTELTSHVCTEQRLLYWLNSQPVAARFFLMQLIRHWSGEDFAPR